MGEPSLGRGPEREGRELVPSRGRLRCAFRQVRRAVLRSARPLGFFLLSCLLVPAACTRQEGAPQREGAPPDETWGGEISEAILPLRPPEGTDQDWEVLARALRTAFEEGLDTLPIGEAMVRIGMGFVGTPYAPGTLELAGPEQVVVNLEAFDCVTFVENVLAMARFLRFFPPETLESRLALQRSYRALLQELRYRDGRVEGYPSRLHYFSDWIRDNEARGIVKEVTEELGGVTDPRAIDFMTRHPEAYRQLADPANREAMRQVEIALSVVPRFRIPEEDLPARLSGIRDGDILAATSTEEGLDVAHVGLALWQGGELHLLHAPLVGDSVEVSRLPLTERLWRLESQDGVRVVRPLEPSQGAASPSLSRR